MCQIGYSREHASWAHLLHWLQWNYLSPFLNFWYESLQNRHMQSSGLSFMSILAIDVIVVFEIFPSLKRPGVGLSFGLAGLLVLAVDLFINSAL